MALVGKAEVAMGLVRKMRSLYRKFPLGVGINVASWCGTQKEDSHRTRENKSHIAIALAGNSLFWRLTATTQPPESLPHWHYFSCFRCQELLCL